MTAANDNQFSHWPGALQPRVSLPRIQSNARPGVHGNAKPDRSHDAGSSAAQTVAFAVVLGVVIAGDSNNSFADDDITLDTIEVIGNSDGEAAESTGDVVHSEYTGTYRRVDSDTLERGGIGLGELLAQESGVQSRQAGGFGSFQTVTVRAATGAQTGIYLDGILLNSAGTAVVDLSTLELLNLNAVDLYSGSAPLQLGHGGIGGAINLRSATAVDGDDDGGKRTAIKSGTGSFGAARLQLAHRDSGARWQSTAAASHQRSDNDYHFLNDNGTPLNERDDRVQRRQNSSVVRNALLATVGYDWSPTRHTDVTLQLASRDLGVPEYRNSEANEASYVTATQQLQLSQRVESLGNWNARHTLYLHRDAAEFDDSLSQVGLGAQDTASLATTTGVRTYWERVGRQGTFGLSADARREAIGSKDSLDGSRNFDADRLQTLATAHYAWIDRRERWTVTPAVRVQRTVDTVNELAGEPDDRKRRRSHSTAGIQLGARLDVSSSLSWFANVGQYYREPSFGELFGSIGLVEANPNLHPEAGVNFDTGFTLKQGKHWRLESSLFASQRDELIVTVYDARGIGRAVNTGKADVIGAEMSLDLQFSDRWNLRTNLTTQDARNRQSLSDVNDKQLPGEARHSAHSRLQYNHKPWRAWYEVDLSRKRWYDTANILRAPDTLQQSVGIEWHQGRWRSGLSVSNLTDEPIEDFNGFAKPGRHWYLTVSLDL